MGSVVGSGIIANRFMDYQLQSRCLIFAGSVHDSQLRDQAVIEREEEALKDALLQNRQAIFVYFSTCSIQDPTDAHSPYASHKLRMEKLVESSALKYLIIRLPQFLGLANCKSNLINFLVDAVAQGKTFDVWQNAHKNFIDIDDVYLIVHELLTTGSPLNRTVNVASTENTPVIQVVELLEGYFGKKANYRLVDKGSSFTIDVSETKDLMSRMGMKTGPEYLLQAVDKYFRHLKEPARLLSVIVPTYNEEHGIEEFYKRTKAVLKTLEPRFTHEIIFVNDFSTDHTLDKLRALASQDQAIKLVNFSRNFGNQIAITAGIDLSRGDIAVIIDDDLQDPPEVILNFLGKWSAGYKVVYGVRPKRQGVNFFFKLLARFYYRLISVLSEIKIPHDTGDFRLIDRVVIDKLRLMKEENRYYRGMVAWVGFPQTGVLYQRDRRYAGVSTFSLKKYINFAFNGLTSFTDKPLYFSSLLGFFITIVGFAFASTLIIYKLVDPSFSIRGWTSLMAFAIFFGGIQLFSVGIVGIYISKIYREVKNRPLYIIDETTSLT